MYYAHVVNITTLVALSSIAAKQTKSTFSMGNHVTQLLDYLITHRDATICSMASNMILNIQSDVLHLSEPWARSCLGGVFFLGILLQPCRPILLNGPIQTIAKICKFVVPSTAEVELSALFHNCQEATILCLALKELGHLQPPTPVHCDNSTTFHLLMTQSKSNSHVPWTKTYFGLLTKWLTNISMLNDILLKKIWPAILQNISMLATIN